jgi:Xaa-Pro aminopeptidase
MPADCHAQITRGFKGVRLVDVTDEFVRLRYHKTDWEIEQIRAGFKLAEASYDAMKKAIAPGVSEIEVGRICD